LWRARRESRGAQASSTFERAQREAGGVSRPFVEHRSRPSIHLQGELRGQDEIPMGSVREEYRRQSQWRHFEIPSRLQSGTRATKGTRESGTRGTKTEVMCVVVIDVICPVDGKFLRRAPETHEDRVIMAHIRKEHRLITTLHLEKLWYGPRGKPRGEQAPWERW